VAEWRLVPLVVDTPLGDLDVNGWTLVWSLVVVAGTIMLARYAGRAVRRFGQRVPSLDADVLLQIARAVRYAIYALGAGIVLGLLGAPIQPVLIALLLVLGALVLVGRGVADNFGAGLVIQVRHPLRLEDLIESEGHRGRVVDLNSRAVVLEKADGSTVHVPNSTVMNSPLVNLSASGHARSELEVRIVTVAAPAEPSRGAAAADPDVVDLVLGAAREVAGVLPDPEPGCPMTAATPTEVVLRLQVWHDPEDGLAVCSRVTAALRASLQDAGLQFAIAWPPPVSQAPPPGAR
jgi:small-conductance mechanosensitive channel